LGGLRFTINGEIGSPGTKTISKSTIMEAIVMLVTSRLLAIEKPTVMKTPTGVVMQDIDLTDINAMKSLLLFAAQ
jgi:polysaccharide export outer membrane protein